MSGSLGELGSLVISLEADIAEFSSAMSKAAHEAQERSKQINEAIDTVKEGFAVLGVGIGLDSLVESIRSIAEEADQMGKFAQKAGTTVEAFSSMAYAARLADVDTQTFAQGLEKLSRTMLSAKQGSIQAQATFAALKIDPNQYKSADDVMLAIADRFEKMRNGATKTALSMQLFGKSGAELIPLLNSGSQEIAQMQAEAQKLGITFSDEDAKSAEEFNDNLTRLDAASHGLKITLANEMMPWLTDVSKAMVQAAKDGGLLQAAWVGLGGLGAALYTDEFASNEKKLSNLRAQLGDLEHHLSMVENDGGLLNKWIFGSKGDLEKEIAQKQAEIAAFMKNMNAPEHPAAAKKPDEFKPNIVPVTKSAGESFIEQLKRQIEQIDKDQYAMLRLQAAQKGVAQSAEPYIRALQKANQAHQDRIDRETAQANNLKHIEDIFNQDNFYDPAAIDDWAAAQKRANDLIDFQTSLIGKNADEVEILTHRHQLMLDVDNQIRQAEADGHTMSMENQETLRQAANKAADDYTAAKRRQLAADHDWVTGAKNAMHSYIETITNSAQQANMLMTDSFKGMEDALVNFVKTGKLDFRSLADSIITDLIRIEIQRKIMAPLIGTVEKPGILSSLLGSMMGGIFGGGKASGGPVVAGTTYLVGESGPELLTMGTGGYITPNHQLMTKSSKSGGDSYWVSIQVNAADNSSQTSGNSTSNLTELGHRIEATVKNVIVNEQRPGGLLAPA